MYHHQSLVAFVDHNHNFIVLCFICAFSFLSFGRGGMRVYLFLISDLLDIFYHFYYFISVCNGIAKMCICLTL